MIRKGDLDKIPMNFRREWTERMKDDRAYPTPSLVWLAGRRIPRNTQLFRHAQAREHSV